MRAGALGLLMLAACGGDGADGGGARPELSFSGLIMSEYDHGRLSFHATASRATGSLTDLVLEDLRVEHQGSAHTGAVVIRAGRGQVTPQKGGVELDAGVVVTDSLGRVLRAERGSYDPERKTITAPGRVTLVGRDLTVTATEVRGLLGNEELTVIGPIEGTFSAEP